MQADVVTLSAVTVTYSSLFKYRGRFSGRGKRKQMHRHTHTHRRPAKLLIGSFKSRFYFHSSYCNDNTALVSGAIKGIEYCIKMIDSPLL